MELLIGCGPHKHKQLVPVGGSRDWTRLVTLDFNDAHKPDVVHDLNQRPWPFEDDTFEEVHAYEVLEHLGRQGDFRAFFADFMEIWRILKPGGLLVGTSPDSTSRWAWGDPGHTRVICDECLVFLSQEEYRIQVGRTHLTDYRFCYRGDFDILHSHVTEDRTFQYVLRAVKPSRIERTA